MRNGSINSSCPAKGYVVIISSVNRRTFLYSLARSAALGPALRTGQLRLSPSAAGRYLESHDTMRGGEKSHIRVIIPFNKYFAKPCSDAQESVLLLRLAASFGTRLLASFGA